ncbi:TRDC protein, partial [Atlantisia rogersi]|nr:TRDC protein [Atlantisia rogersi]
LKSKKPRQYDNKLNMACLARAFYPKNISLDMPTSDIVFDLMAPLVTSEGTYTTMKVTGLEPDAEVTCKAIHKGNKTPASIILPGTGEGYIKTLSVSLSLLLLFKSDIKMEKVNMQFMTVLGLRVLLAKSIAINSVMTIKLLLL